MMTRLVCNSIYIPRGLRSLSTACSLLSRVYLKNYLLLVKMRDSSVAHVKKKLSSRLVNIVTVFQSEYLAIVSHARTRVQ